jgi:hypothetical protein
VDILTLLQNFLKGILAKTPAHFYLRK